MELQYNSTAPRIVGKSKAFPNGRRFSGADNGKPFTVADDCGKALLKLGIFEEVKPKRRSETPQTLGGLE